MACALSMMRVGPFPTKRLVPSARVTGRSIFSCSARQGTSRIVVSACIPRVRQHQPRASHQVQELQVSLRFHQPQVGHCHSTWPRNRIPPHPAWRTSPLPQLVQQPHIAQRVHAPPKVSEPASRQLALLGRPFSSSRTRDLDSANQALWSTVSYLTSPAWCAPTGSHPVCVGQRCEIET